MLIKKTGAKQITLSGITYHADARGIINVPDDKMLSSIWSRGYVPVEDEPVIEEPVVVTEEPPKNPVKTTEPKEKK